MMFNEEQREHMKWLASIPPEKRCWCGWYRLGTCPHCPEGRTGAEKLARKQPCCGYTPAAPDGPDGHYFGCAAKSEAT